MAQIALGGAPALASIPDLASRRLLRPIPAAILLLVGLRILLRFRTSRNCAMSVDDLQLARATTADLDEILELLRASSLPPDGVAEQLSGFFVVRDSTGRLIACAGVERYGPLGLLRSVAVNAELQRSGLGSRLVRTVLDEAQHSGIDEVVLLTTTARDFFAHRFGFKETTREPYAAQLAQSVEWQLPRCSSAVVMSLRLAREATA